MSNPDNPDDCEYRHNISVFFLRAPCLDLESFMIRKLLVCVVFIFSGLLFTGCQRGTTVRVVKPKKHWFPYNQAKDRRKKRTRIVRMKS